MNCCPLFPQINSNSFILASGSPRRKDLLQNMGLEPEIIIPQIDEDLKDNEIFEHYLERVTKDKSIAVLKQLDKNDTRFVLSADTIVILNNQLLQKPQNKNEAKLMLTKLSGQTHIVRTGYCISNKNSEDLFNTHFNFCESRITIRNISSNMIDAYIKTNEPMDKAGAYGAQGIGSLLIERIEGTYDNVVGLPVYACLQELAKLLP